jgi:hypothetical protein
MGLNMSRDHEETDVASAGLAPKKPVAPAPAAELHPAEADFVETPEPVAVVEETPAVEVQAPPAAVQAAPAAAARKPVNPNRRPLPPIGTGRRPGDEPIKRRRLRGALRLIIEVLVGGLIGGGIGYGAVRYLGITADQAKQLYIGSGAGVGALLFGFWGLLHFDHH